MTFNKTSTQMKRHAFSFRFNYCSISILAVSLVWSPMAARGAPPANGKNAETMATRFDHLNTTGWFSKALDDNKSFIDLSDLNDKPAGKHGFVQSRGGHFVFADGTPVRFWGASVAAGSIYQLKNDKPDFAVIDAQAKRLAQLGYNIVRLTHVDSFFVDPSFLVRNNNRSDQINDAGLNCLFYWVKALKEQGIYCVVDMITYRPFFKGDNIPGWDEIARHRAQGNNGALVEGYSYINDRIQELWETTSKQLVTRISPYTGIALKDEPDVMAIVIWNENDLTLRGGLTFLGDKGNPFHRKLFLEKLDSFSKKYSLEAGALGMTWVPGPNKLLLNDMEYQANHKLVQFLRDLGAKSLMISGHSWGDMPAFSLPALTAGDIIDSHAYVGPEFIRLNPRVADNDFMTFAQGTLADHPKFITEYNMGVDATNRDRYTVPLYAAALAAFQNYDGMTMFAYSQSGFAGVPATMWDTFNNPQVMGMAPVGALIFRLQGVSPAMKTLYVPLTAETGLFKDVSVKTSATLRTGFETHAIRLGFGPIKELPWFKPTRAPANAQVVTDLKKDLIPPGNEVTSDTSQITRNWVKGQFTINAPRAQLVMGAIGGEVLHTADATFEIQSPQGAVALCSLDRQPLKQSRRILLSTAARVMPGKQGSGIAYLSEPLAGTIKFSSAVHNLELIPLKGNGTRLAPIAIQSKGGVYTIDLPTNLNTHWFELDAQ